MKTLLLLHAAATCYMCGVIWFVQLVHYPLFSTVGRSEFVAYQLQHVRRTGWVVGPAMLLEASAALALCIFPTADLSPALLWSGLGLLALVWLSPFAWQVRSNWLRTVLWTVRAGLALYLLPVWD